MKAEELRIGNFIASSGNPKNIETCVVGKVHSISSMDTQFEQIEVETEEEFIWFFKNSYFGIPLTEKWLIDFGFKKYAESSVCKGWAIGVNPITQDYLLNLTWMKNEDGTLAECFYKNGYFTIQHVHQLQNLYFALTRKELRIMNREEKLKILEK